MSPADIIGASHRSAVELASIGNEIMLQPSVKQAALKSRSHNHPLQSTVFGPKRAPADVGVVVPRPKRVSVLE